MLESMLSIKNASWFLATNISANKGIEGLHLLWMRVFCYITSLLDHCLLLASPAPEDGLVNRGTGYEVAINGADNIYSYADPSFIPGIFTVHGEEGKIGNVKGLPGVGFTERR